MAGLVRRVLFLPSWSWCSVCVNKIKYFFCLWSFCVDWCYKGKNPLNILNIFFCIQSKNILLSGVICWEKYWIFLGWATFILGESSKCVWADERASCIFLQNRGKANGSITAAKRWEDYNLRKSEYKNITTIYFAKLINKCKVNL